MGEKEREGVGGLHTAWVQALTEMMGVNMTNEQMSDPERPGAPGKEPYIRKCGKTGNVPVSVRFRDTL